MTPRVIVAGAGVAGLSTALALERAGIEVLVLERQDGPSEVAAGLQLWFNGVRAAEALGVADALRARGTPLARCTGLASLTGQGGRRDAAGLIS